ncbi:hypothetical protein P7C73_g3113, partial [Tremellales sp. Uapishka_1]
MVSERLRSVIAEAGINAMMELGTDDEVIAAHQAVISAYRNPPGHQLSSWDRVTAFFMNTCLPEMRKGCVAICRWIEGTGELSSLISLVSSERWTVSAMPGDIDQSQREVIMKEFRSGSPRVLNDIANPSIGWTNTLIILAINAATIAIAVVGNAGRGFICASVVLLSLTIFALYSGSAEDTPEPKMRGALAVFFTHPMPELLGAFLDFIKK